MNRIFALLLVVFFSSCHNNEGKTKSADTASSDSIIEPTDKKIYNLPIELREISGISFVDDHTIAAIQDEEGILYFYDLNKKEIVNKYEFWKGKDYEDLTVVGEDLWVVSSSGTLYFLKDFKKGPVKATIYKTSLSAQNNIEGLTYDKKNNRLLLSVKDISLDGDETHKDIYTFDLKTKTLDTTAVYSIRISDVESYFAGDKLEEFSKKFLKAVGNKNLNDVFRTSALAFHPQTGELYVLSSLNNVIAIIGQDKKISKILEFDGKEFSQPEGLAFRPDGKLFISNEGKKTPCKHY